MQVIDALQKVNVDQLVNKATKYSQENPVVVGAIGVFGLFGFMSMMRTNKMRRDGKDYNSVAGTSRLLNSADHTLKGNEFSTSVNDYEGMFAGARESTGAITSDDSVELRKERYADMVNHFYNLVTDFYEYGWGQSFHFGPRFKNEDFLQSIRRAEYYLAARLGLTEKSHVLDVGCGVGGPMRNISVFSGCKIDGITINQYQVNVGNRYNLEFGLESRCRSHQGDFQTLPWADSTFDAAYQIEATCHSPDRVQTFKGIHRVLKTGGLFTGYEWVMLDGYDKGNKDHVRVKEGIEVGNGLPTLVHYSVVVQNLKDAGFEVLDHFDANRDQFASNNIPWYDTLNGKMSLDGFRMTHIGRCCTHALVWFLELVMIAPRGSTKVSALLNATALDLVEGGEAQIFTPSYFFLAKKV
jgi:sterol 24-C-methyltransferase